MRKFITLFLGLSLLILNTSLAQAESKISPEKISVIKELIDMMDFEKMDLQFAKQMAIVIRDGVQSTDKSTPSSKLDLIENAAYTAYLEEIKSDEYIQGMYSIFDRHYSLEDLKEMVAFYKTPLGQKWLKTLPLLAEDSTKFGMEWNSKVMPKVMAKIKTRLDETNTKSQTKE